MIYINGVSQLRGDNFVKWKTEIDFILLMMDKDHSLRMPAVVAPVSQGTEHTTLVARTAAYEKEKERWKHSDRVALSFMNMTINPSIIGALDKSLRMLRTS
ncbi:uncharacterized protein C2845_PM03G14320 [Panicum miliaceum]|uniref:Retrotransposon Copia-like N-terminal domain-containing protein n=1 Tax=Panicum miliaceum TaxID=4540 RepID=A0A3L6T9F4_PANMI|nr:uncharacterized protein C2845_PM03G14320 [Panicum miliaceum]